MAKHRGYDVSAVTLIYGQTHERELASAVSVAGALGMRHRAIDVAFFKELAWYSALTSPDRFAIPTGRSAREMSAGIPMTYVPMRNTLFVTLGAALLESEALSAIEVAGTPADEIDATLFIAANALDYSGYPDCRPEYYAATQETLRLGSKLGTQYAAPIKLETPIIGLGKADIVRLGVELGAPIELTWSCYEGGVSPCGRCDSCLLRARGFAEAGVVDPAL